jgi:hypothetical protein
MIFKTLRNPFDGSLLALLLLLSLIPWFVVQIQQSVNVDNAWLTIAAMRLLDGQKMSEAYYDSNPPLSILVQIIPAALTKFLKIPLPYAIFFYSLITIFLSTGAVWHIFKKTGWLESSLLNAFLAFYIVANTVGTGQYIGERDHFLVLGLFPFLLLQISLTQNIPVNRYLKWMVLSLGSIAVLIKPHYGLIPVLILLHRMVRQKRLVCFDADFLALTAAVLGYIAIMLIFFNDYMQIIFSDALLFYMAMRENWAVPLAGGIAVFLTAFICASWLLFKRPHLISMGFFIAAALCLIPFAIQAKGFFYQAIPCMIFFLSGLFFLIEKSIFTAGTRLFSLNRPMSGILAFILMTFFIYFFSTPNKEYPTHQDYKNSQLVEIINSCGNECTFFMLNDMTEMIHQLAVYTGKELGSRFPVYWFLPVIVQENYNLEHGLPSRFNAEQMEFYKKKYAAFVTEDFKKYIPDILLIGRFKMINGQEAYWNFSDFVIENDPSFASIWKNYKLTESVQINRSDYFGNTLYKNDDYVTYDIYRKRQQ